ncbi:MAG: RrF2 family transcriptional regulator [Ardenticatenaceae bacterium]
MRISTKGEYGVRALFDLAQQEGEGLVQSATIAARQQVPEKYLSQLLLTMRKKGLIHSVRGPQGGHMLARPASKISLGEALTALEGPLVPMECVKPDFTDCCLLDMCVIRDVWCDLKAATDEVLYSTTLADLLNSHMQRKAQAMYYI